jgi:hypothetical protein
MSSNTQRKGGWKKLFHGFSFAINGLWLIIKHEKHFRFELLIAFMVLIIGVLFEISYFEWLILIVTISLVLIAEAINQDEASSFFQALLHPLHNTSYQKLECLLYLEND